MWCCFGPAAASDDDEEEEEPAEAAPLLNESTAMVPGTERGMRLSVSEIRALRAIYDDTGGLSWTESGGWDDARAAPNMWYGVTVVDGHVTGLDLGGNGLRGPFPAAVTQLVHLEYLDLQNNDLQGPVPDLSPLGGLKWLYLNDNSLSGRVPPSIGDLTRLQYLHLQGNTFQGALPDSFAQLADLRVLQMGAEQKQLLPSQVAGAGAQGIVEHLGQPPPPPPPVGPVGPVGPGGVPGTPPRREPRTWDGPNPDSPNPWERRRAEPEPPRSPARGMVAVPVAAAAATDWDVAASSAAAAGSPRRELPAPVPAPAPAPASAPRSVLESARLVASAGGDVPEEEDFMV